MPVTYRIVSQLDLVWSTWDGVVTLEDGLQHNDFLRADPDFHPAMRQLSDARGAESAVKGPDIRGLARRSAFGPESRRAILVSDDAIFGVSRMYEARAQTAGEVRVFRELSEALDWLEIDEPTRQRYGLADDNDPTEPTPTAEG